MGTSPCIDFLQLRHVASSTRDPTCQLPRVKKGGSVCVAGGGGHFGKLCLYMIKYSPYSGSFQ